MINATYFYDTQPGRREVLPTMAYTGKLRPNRVPFSFFKDEKKVVISLVEVDESVGRYVIFVCKKAQKG